MNIHSYIGSKCGNQKEPQTPRASSAIPSSMKMMLYHNDDHGETLTNNNFVKNQNNDK